MLEIYGREHGPHVAVPERIGYCIAALQPFWGGVAGFCYQGRDVPEIRREAHSIDRPARRELECLQSAMKYCEREGYLIQPPKVTFPPKSKGRTRWMTRKETAALLRSAWRNEHSKRHLATFILIALYTGTRHQAILNLQWLSNTRGGWVDLDKGLLFRSASEARETNKRQPPCPILRRLLAHLKRVWLHTNSHVIEWNGKPILKMKRAWHRARKEAGLGEDVTPHVLRHTCVTWLLQRRVPIWEVAGYVGMSEAMVNRTYGHHSPDFLRTAREAF